MKKATSVLEITLTSLIFFVFTFFIFVTIADAAETGDVTATVTVQNVAMTLSNATVTYDTMSIGTTKTTNTTGTDESTYASNTGNISQDFNIKGAHSTSVGETWAIVVATGTIDEYTHRYCISDCDGTPTWISLAIGYTELTTGIGASGTTPLFDLEIGVPDSVTDYDETTVVVTVQTVAT